MGNIIKVGGVGGGWGCCSGACCRIGARGTAGSEVFERDSEARTGGTSVEDGDVARGRGDVETAAGVEVGVFRLQVRG